MHDKLFIDYIAIISLSSIFTKFFTNKRKICH